MDPKLEAIWGPQELEVDPDFSDLSAQIGFRAERCPVCHAHLHQSGICLNACHLSPGARARFQAHMRSVTE